MENIIAETENCHYMITFSMHFLCTQMDQASRDEKQ